MLEGVWCVEHLNKKAYTSTLSELKAKNSVWFGAINKNRNHFPFCEYKHYKVWPKQNAIKYVV